MNITLWCRKPELRKFVRWPCIPPVGLCIQVKGAHYRVVAASVDLDIYPEEAVSAEVIPIAEEQKEPEENP